MDLVGQPAQMLPLQSIGALLVLAGWLKSSIKKCCSVSNAIVLQQVHHPICVRAASPSPENYLGEA